MSGQQDTQPGNKSAVKSATKPNDSTYKPIFGFLSSLYSSLAATTAYEPDDSVSIGPSDDPGAPSSAIEHTELGMINQRLISLDPVISPILEAFRMYDSWKYGFGSCASAKAIYLDLLTSWLGLRLIMNVL